MSAVDRQKPYIATGKLVTNMVISKIGDWLVTKMAKNWTDFDVKNLTAEDKIYTRLVGDGLYIMVRPTGEKSWQFKYAIDGKTRRMNLGGYPDVSLAQARKTRTSLAAKVLEGVDPLGEREANKKTQKPEFVTFESVALKWFELKSPGWTGKKYAKRTLGYLNDEILPVLGKMDVQAVEPQDVLRVVDPISKREAHEVAHKVRGIIEQIYRYAIAAGLTKYRNPADGVQEAMTPRPPVKNQPALLRLPDLRQLLCDVAAKTGDPKTKLAIFFNALTAVRPGEVRGALWSEMELDGVWTDEDGNEHKQAFWRIPAARMKMRRDHVVPLSRQALDILEKAKIFCGNNALVFPGKIDAFSELSDGTMNEMLKDLGYQDKHTPHGWRSSFSSVMNTKYSADYRVIDMMLAHVVGGQAKAASATEGVYNRADFIERRIFLSQAWADLLMQDVPQPGDWIYGKRRTG